MVISTGLKSAASALALAATLVGGQAYAQKSKVPDAQVQANVLRDMAKEPTLAQQQIQASTAFGVVTLTGNVTDNAARDLADRVASHAEGVAKVVDQLSVGGTGNAAAPADADAGVRAASVVPPPPVSDTQGPPAPQVNPEDQDGPDDAGAPPQYAQGGYPQQQQQQGYPSAQQSYPQGQSGDPYADQQAPPPQGQRRRIYRRDYDGQNGQMPGPDGQYAQQQYGPQGGQYAPQGQYGRQRGYRNGGPSNLGGVAVTVPAGTPVNVRLDRWLSSGRVAPGHVFQGFVAQDVVAGGQVALPRGTQVTGTVIDVTQPGALKGSGSITLQLQTATLGGQQYPLQSEPWTINGRDKTGQTVGTTAVMGIFGALIGGAVGGGGGALAGAGIGAAGGLGVSAASGGGNAIIPGEAKVTFRLDQPVNVTTVSSDEMARLSQNVGPEAAYQPRPVYAAPVAPYPYYGGYGYPYAYGYPYYPGVGLGVTIGRPYYRPYYYGRYPYRRW